MMNNTIKDIEETLETLKSLFKVYKDESNKYYKMAYLHGIIIGARVIIKNCERLIEEMEK